MYPSQVSDAVDVKYEAENEARQGETQERKKDRQ